MDVEVWQRRGGNRLKLENNLRTKIAKSGPDMPGRTGGGHHHELALV
jgi:hypothetical protein